MLTKKEALKLLGVGKQVIPLEIYTDSGFSIYDMIFLNYNTLAEAKRKENKLEIANKVSELAKYYDCTIDNVNLYHIYAAKSSKTADVHMGHYYAHEYDEWLDCIVYSFNFSNTACIVKVLDENYSVADGIWESQDNGCGDYFKIYGQPLK